MKPVRVLIVDDSATMRGFIAAALADDPMIEIAGQASDPLEAREAIKTLNPDVITLDVEMPNMNGLAFLAKLMRLRPMPVIMVSSLTQYGAEVSLAALELGAFDCVGKPISGLPTQKPFDELPGKIKAAARARVRSPSDSHPLDARIGSFVPDGRIIAIGSSTGGVEALLAILSAFPANCPPTVIAQHMPGAFTGSFADRLDRACAASVRQASDGAILEPGSIYLAPGGQTHLEISRSEPARCRLHAADHVNGHRPSVDVLFSSVARAVGEKALGVILTGMGRDGADGMLAMRRTGAATIGQDEASSVVYGMPKAAFDLGAVERQLPLEQIGSTIIAMCNAARVAAQ